MSGINRLPAPAGRLIDRSRAITFSFEGRSVQGHAGDTIASALAANDSWLLSRSFKYHRPRGILTMAGQDANTLVQIGDEPNVLADRRAIEDGLVVSGQNYKGSLAADCDSWLEQLGRFMPVGFYYKAFYKRGSWKFWEPIIRGRAGLGKVDPEAHHGSYDKEYLFADVVVVGGGPAGLAAAEQLRRQGYRVHVYDRHDRLGGLLIYGIPNFKLEKEVVLRRAQLLADAGVRFSSNFEVGRDASLAELRARHDAILIATGVYRPRDLQAPGSGLGNIVPALDYLITSNRKGLGDAVPEFDDGSLNAEGKHVVVIGGGDTAMDCVRTAVRQGAKSVKCLYRRDRANMPGSQREVGHAEEEGVEFVWLAAPEAFLGNDDGTVSAVRAARIHLGVADATGRQTPRLIDGSHFTVPADLVIKALGFDPEDLPGAFGDKDLAVTRWGTLKISYKTQMTSLDGVFAAGDIVRGASLVVWAIRDGRDAAAHIHDYIQAKAAGVSAVAAE